MSFKRDSTYAGAFMPRVNTPQRKTAKPTADAGSSQAVQKPAKVEIIQSVKMNNVIL